MCLGSILHRSVRSSLRGEKAEGEESGKREE